MNELWAPLWLSVQIATCATAVTLLVGVPLAFAMGRRRRFIGKSFIESLILLPLVLPPTVVGYLILMTLGKRGWLAGILHGYSIVFKFEGAVLASAVVALPMLYMPTRAAFAGVDRELEDIAKLMGANRLQMFWHVSLPMARRGLLSGLILAFARALGEFGATLMVFGWRKNSLTLPISIYSNVFDEGKPAAALPAVLALSAVSLLMVLAYNRSSVSRQG